MDDKNAAYGLWLWAAQGRPNERERPQAFINWFRDMDEANRHFHFGRDMREAFAGELAVAQRLTKKRVSH